MTSDSDVIDKISKDVEWIKNKLNKKVLSKENRAIEYEKNIHIMTLSVIIALQATLLIEIIKILLEFYIQNRLLLLSITILIFFALSLIILQFLIPRFLRKITELYELNKDKISGEIAGRDIDEKLKMVETICKEIIKQFSNSVALEFNPILTSQKCVGLSCSQRENLLFEKISSLNSLDVLFKDVNLHEVAKIQIQIFRAEGKADFFCLSNCDGLGKMVSNRIKEYADKSGFLQSLETNF